jgi:hypothetical protein
MKTADPHCHTLSSDGMVSPAELVEAAVKAGLDLIAVTDHDTMEAVRETQRRGEDAGIIVVAGQEITTRWPTQTHIMGWYLEAPIRRGMSLEDTVDAIHAQGALAIIPHPFVPVYFGSIQPGALRRLIDRHPVDGVEVVFTVPLGARRRRQLGDFYTAHSDRLGAAIGGSDSHFGFFDIARAVTEYDSEFRTAIRNKSTVPSRRRGHPGVPVSLVARQQWRALVDLPIRRLLGRL